MYPVCVRVRRPHSSSALLGAPASTPSRSPSVGSVATRSTGPSSFSSGSGVSAGELGAKMSSAMLEGSTSQDWASRVESCNKKQSRSSNPQSMGATEEIIEEGVDGVNNNMQTQRGRPGYQDHTRPVIERQGSYSKRHSSFDTHRETPYPQGHFIPPAPAHLHITVDKQEQTTSVCPEHSDTTAYPTESTKRETTSNSSPTQQDSRSDSSGSECMSSHSAPLPNSVPYSALPTIAPPSQDSSSRYMNPRPAPNPLVSSSSKPSYDTIPVTSQKIPSRQSPSPPLLADDDIDMNISPPLLYSSRFSDPLPPRLAALYSKFTTRPTSLPHVPTGNATLNNGNTSIPPPQPPTILTPPPPLSRGNNRTPAPHEPFLPPKQPPPDHTHIAVETLNHEYILVVRLPGFQRDAITLAARRRRVLHVVADSWSENGGHFERRITFGYDADLYSVRAEFDGEFLKIHVPRKFVPGRPVPTQQ